MLPTSYFQYLADLIQHTIPNEVNKQNLLNTPVTACLILTPSA